MQHRPLADLRPARRNDPCAVISTVNSIIGHAENARLENRDMESETTAKVDSSELLELLDDIV